MSGVVLGVAFQIGYLAMTLAAFAGLALFTRARPRRIAGAVVSVLVFTAISAPIDTIGRRGGWWSYPAYVDPPHPPLLLYLGQAFGFVGTLALIGWRVGRGFGARGLAILTAIVCAVGLARDLAIAAAMPELVRFGAQPAAAVADVLAWALVVAVALGVTRAVAGPARADALR
jgi:hypothetical protein